MCRCERGAHIDGYAQRLGYRQLGSGNDSIFESLAGDELHHDVMLRAVLANIKDAYDIGMRQARGEARFLFKTPQKLLILGELGQENLCGHTPAQTQVLGFIHPGHTTFAEDAYELVPTAEHVFIHAH